VRGAARRGSCASTRWPTPSRASSPSWNRTARSCAPSPRMPRRWRTSSWPSPEGSCGMYKPRPPLVELTIVRTKEFLRETEAIFWVFGFPLLLALALGFAFRSKPPDKIPIGVVEGPAAQQRLAALARSPALLPHIVALKAGQEELRRGKISLLIEGDGQPVYRYDPTRPDSRTARV